MAIGGGQTHGHDRIKTGLEVAPDALSDVGNVRSRAQSVPESNVYSNAYELYEFHATSVKRNYAGKKQWHDPNLRSAAEAEISSEWQFMLDVDRATWVALYDRLQGGDDSVLKGSQVKYLSRTGHARTSKGMGRMKDEGYSSAHPTSSPQDCTYEVRLFAPHLQLPHR